MTSARRSSSVARSSADRSSEARSSASAPGAAGAGRPRLALAATPGSARELVAFLALVGRGADIVSWHARGGRAARATIDAVVASDPAVLDQVLAELAAAGSATGAVAGPAAGPGRSDDVPVACRVRDESEVRAAAEAGVEVAFTHDPDLLDTGAVLVPARGIEVDRLPVLPPLVRQRMRSAQGLPDRLVLAVHGPADADRTTGLALAAAAVVDEEMLPLALALGTPVVTDAAAAAAFGLRPGVEVEVADDAPAADRLAAAVAREPDRAAALSRRARAFAEHHLDLGRPADMVRHRLGLAPPSSLLDRRLAELATPPGAAPRLRARAALAGFPIPLEQPA